MDSGIEHREAIPDDTLEKRRGAAVDSVQRLCTSTASKTPRSTYREIFRVSPPATPIWPMVPESRSSTSVPTAPWPRHHLERVELRIVEEHGWQHADAETFHTAETVMPVLPNGRDQFDRTPS
jgi:hypothetical protein